MAAICVPEWLPGEDAGYHGTRTAAAPSSGAAAVPPPPSSDGGVTVVTAHGEIDIATADALRARLVAALSRHGHVAVDLAEVTFIDCGGLRALTGAHQVAVRAGRRLTLRTPSPPVARLLALTRLDRELAVEPDTGSATPAQ
ncbi:STAS domain-containing protein [Kitasatospora sp. DSM 101779]|uniref:STAS domain-containing protein n=1 Tax=Kitasatospora sp. DSM 101779 TaxID=2853165 RepID=UPI0021D9FA60|nr:STAS domain-containing protein [Kitasatospora sp. DSM 101779]MCU7826745.1 STAS domain-containing protein [Kitasatospora sp. DSM 101779]